MPLPVGPVTRIMPFGSLSSASRLFRADGLKPSDSKSSAALEPAPTLELRSVVDGRARYDVTFWAKDRETVVAAGIAALRARFPQGEVTGA